MKITTISKTTKKWWWPQKIKISQNEEDHKKEDNLKKKDDLKNKNDLKKDDLHIAEMHMALDVFSFAAFLIMTNIYFRYGIV